MRKRRHLNADSDRPTLRLTVVTATEPLREAAFAVEQKVVWKGEDRLRRIIEVVRWPFERVAFFLERRLLWPLRERSAGRELPGGVSGRAVLAVSAAAATVVVLAVVLASTGSQAGAPQVAEQARVAIVPEEEAQPAAKPSKGPTLEGVAPSFPTATAADGGGGRKADAAAGVASAKTAAAPASEGGEGTASSNAAAATTSSARVVPAGPAAMKVARRFSEAFVFYEVGERPARAKAVFAETASPRLARALAKRPPRLPARTRVPKAQVVNLVPGPRRGKDYTVSVSLLRVGLTSELRLSLRPGANGNWEVSDVLG